MRLWSHCLLHFLTETQNLFTGHSSSYLVNGNVRLSLFLKCIIEYLPRDVTYNAGVCRCIFFIYVYIYISCSVWGSAVAVAAAHLSFCLADIGQGQVMAPRGLASLLSWGSYVHTKHIMDEWRMGGPRRSRLHVLAVKDKRKVFVRLYVSPSISSQQSIGTGDQIKHLLDVNVRTQLD